MLKRFLFAGIFLFVPIVSRATAAENLIKDMRAYGNSHLTDGVWYQNTADTRNQIQWKLQAIFANTKYPAFGLGGSYLALFMFVDSRVGFLSQTFTTPDDLEDLDYFRFGLNGQTIDTMVRFDIKDLMPSTTYTIQWRVLNATNGEAAWTDMLVVHCPDGYELALGETTCSRTCENKNVTGGHILPDTPRVYEPEICTYTQSNLVCDPGYYISGNQCSRAPAGTISLGGDSTTYSNCSWDRYANAEQSACIMCPPEYPYTTYRATSIQQCMRTCMGGMYMASRTDTKCTLVKTDEWAPLHQYLYGHDYTTDNTVHKCPAGTYTLGRIGYGADDETDCAHTLYIGDASLRLISKKKTSPALAVSLNGTTYWANMSQTAHPMSDGAIQTLRIAVGDSEYYAFDDSVKTHAPYPWEDMDFNWSEQGVYTYDNNARTWQIVFSDSTWSGVSKCDNGQCYCRMLKPAVSEWNIRIHTGACESQCTLECVWGYAQSPEYKSYIINSINE